MRRGPGRLERAIRALFDAHPDEAFVTNEIATHCYPEAKTIERKHQVAVLRAARKVVEDDPDWWWWVSESHGATSVFVNQANVRSRAMGHVLAGIGVIYRSEKRARRTQNAQRWTISTPDVMDREALLRRLEREMAERGELHERRAQRHRAERDGDAKTVEAVRLEQAKEQAQNTLALAGAVHSVKRAKLMETACKLGMLDYVLLDGPRGSLDNKLQAIAELARKLKTENDADVIRAGLDEIARMAEGAHSKAAVLNPPAD
jgi:hypothetical protein